MNGTLSLYSCKSIYTHNCAGDRASEPLFKTLAIMNPRKRTVLTISSCVLPSPSMLPLSNENGTLTLF